ncbi:MAG: PAS domain-containing protein [Proteobacteria bacterium]|nr:PAS domain-containing protein [Pseudomonadota bacterium]MBU1387511.1 PAS domain-containing protein [Pseudomonadota bacterium]MBU1543188.1 PAS domain-containing protein [Pseudomonadota bacterium]MBU2480068.1 PAS domain-containing protein [Pseudomonadota bacterium]
MDDCSDKDQSQATEENASSDISLYVGIGASAGGLEAIQTFFQSMPLQSSFAFIVVQHLSPDYKSLMVELLSKKTAIPVFRAEDGMEVKSNSIYLIPPRKNLKIFHGKLLLSDQDHSKGLNLPIDIFLRSLAEDQGEKSAAIILSGTGSDGMRGIRSIKEQGGIVIVQDEKTAKFDGMPRSAISTGLSDFILPPEKIPEQLISYIKHPYSTKENRHEKILEDEGGLTKILSLLRERFKIDFTFYKPSTVNRRIERRMSFNQIIDVREYADFAFRNPSEIATLYRELLIGVTNFFRDPEMFQLLAEEWLPQLLKNPDQHEYRFWTTACSTGEEAYSIAITARECLEQLGITKDIKIFATDIDKNAVVKAGAGIFPESIAADISPKLLSKYFFRKDENFHVVRNIREMVVFAQHNLIKDPPFTNIDLITCRNLLIYLQPILQKKILNLFNFSLHPGGILILGLSETTGDSGYLFETLNNKNKIYRSRGKNPSPLERSDIIFSNRGGDSHLLQPSRFVENQRHSFPKEENLLQRLVDSLCPDYIPVSMIVNEQLEIQHIVGDTFGLFRLPSGRPVNDISKMVAKELAIPLSTSIQKVFRTKTAQVFSNIKVTRQDAVSSFNLSVRPLQGKKNQESLVVVLIEELKDTPAKEKPEIRQYNFDEEAEHYVHELEQELQFTRENLQATIEELETSNEELQATNEELLASNEELQSTNEELQSTNEELHTVNVEYQNKIMELTESNNDIENLLTSSQVGKLLLDENCEVRRFSTYAQRIIRILDSDIGRPLTHLTHNLIRVDLVEDVRKTMELKVPLEKEVTSKDGDWYFMRILPYEISPGVYSGTVLSFVDITRQKQSQTAFEKKVRQLEDAQKLSGLGVWELNIKDNMLTWSDNVFDIFEIDKNKFNATYESFLNLVHPEDRESVDKLYTQSVKNKTPYTATHRLQFDDGRIKYINEYCRTEYDKAGHPMVSVGVVQDITEQKTMEQRLKKSEQRYRSLFDTIFSGVAVYKSVQNGKDFEFLEFNRFAEKIESMNKNDVIGKRLTAIFPNAQRSGLLDIIRQVWATGKPQVHAAALYEDDNNSGEKEYQIYKLPTGEIVAVYNVVPKN